MKVIVIVLLFTVASVCVAQDYDESGDGSLEGMLNMTDIQDIRLVDGSFGDHMGRVEVMYNNTWGTICDDSWSFLDGRVACRMLGFEDALCTLPFARFGQGNISSPIWMSNLQCRGDEFSLDNCEFLGWGKHFCTHREDAGVICEDENFVETPSDVTLLDSTTTSLTIGWNYFSFLPGASSIRFRVTYESEDTPFRNSRFLIISRSNGATNFNVTLTNLNRDTNYTIRIQTQFRYTFCFSFIVGEFTNASVFRTNETRRISNIPVRLISPITGLDFLGRVEVFHNNEWGTVCDDFFSFSEAGVVCGMLNYTRAICSVSRARMGQGSGRIWLDNVRCRRGEERLDDCDFNDWGDNNCRHRDDVGVICMPDDFPEPVENVTILRVGSNSITVGWNPVEFPRSPAIGRYLIRYLPAGSRFPRTVSVSSTESQFTIRRLLFGVDYNITVTAQVRFTYCFSYISSVESDPVEGTTQESAPTLPPTLFHVEVINCTAVEAQWGLPPIGDRNGFIRGYKLYYSDTSGREVFVNITSNETLEYIIGGLQPKTAYTFSVLAYTVADGPRSIHLVAVTFDSCVDQCISGIGILGDGLDRATRSTFQRDLRIHCNTRDQNTEVDWFFANGTKVGTTNRNFREGHHDNGTTVLQIASNRRLSYCDAGVFTCVANCTSGIERKNFTLIINSSPPSPSKAVALSIKSTSIIIGWDENECNGGHALSSFTIRYSEVDSFFPFGRTITLRNIDKSRRNYTIQELTPATSYQFRVQAVSVDFRTSSFSTSNTITTLSPAPSPPRDVAVRIVTPFIVEITWRIPAIPSGIIVHYTVYAIPLGKLRDRQRRQAELSSPNVIKTIFPSSARAGNITLEAFAQTYQFQVTASTQDQDSFNEGELSAITPNSTIFIPTPGRPTPQNVHVSLTTNASIYLAWDFPPPPVETIKSFKIAYSSVVEWRSSGGVLVRFSEFNEVTTIQNVIKLFALTPGTSYQIKVSAITERGQGAEVTTFGRTTSTSNIVRLAYFRIRMGPLGNCLDFHSGNVSSRLLSVRMQLVNQLHSMCLCNITMLHITDASFSCGQNLVDQVVFRARIIGTENYSAGDLVQLLQSWIGSGSAAITVGFSRMHLDSSCSTLMDNINAPDCPITSTPKPPTTTPPSSTTPTKITTPTKDISTTKVTSDSKQTVDQVRPAEVGGVVIGSIITVLLLVLIGVIVVIVVVKLKPTLPISKNGGATRHYDEEDKTPFADIGESSSIGGDSVPMQKSSTDF